MDTNIALTYLASCGTRLVRAKLFRRIHRLLFCLHILQDANGRLLFQALLTFSPVSDIVGELLLGAQRKHQHILKMSVGNQFANNIIKR